MNQPTARFSPPRSARISPDRPIVGYSVIVLVALVMIAGYVFSFFAIAAAAAWAGIPENAMWIRFTAPVFIDGPIIAYTIAFAVHRWRREMDHSKYARRVLYCMTGVSVLINAAHVASYWSWDFGQYEAIGGTLIAVMAPLGSLFSAEQLIKLAFEPGEAAGSVTLAATVVSAESKTPALEHIAKTEPIAADSFVDAAEATEPEKSEQVAAQEQHLDLHTIQEDGLVGDQENPQAPEHVSELTANEWQMLHSSVSEGDSPVAELAPEIIYDTQVDFPFGDEVLPVDKNGFFLIPGRAAA